MISRLVAFLIAPVAFAKITVPPPPTGSITDTGVLQNVNEIPKLFCGIIDWIFWGLIVFSVIMFLLGAYKYVTSRGEPEKVGGAAKTLTYAAIGVVVALIAAGMPYLVGSFLKTSANLDICQTQAPIQTNWNISGPTDS